MPNTVGLAAGKGLKLLPTQQALAAASAHQRAANPRKRHHELKVAQRYVTNPLLLDGRKFHLRLWVVVTNHNPLTAYLHRWAGAGVQLSLMMLWVEMFPCVQVWILAVVYI